MTIFFFVVSYLDFVHRPKFPEILEMLYKKNIVFEVRTAASQKSKDFYIKCFE